MIYRNKKHMKEQGFTLIELMLAMAFVGFILVFTALTIVQMFRVYDKGTSMKQVNQAGRSIVDDISQAMKSQLYSSIKVGNVDAGTLCIGNIMYVWNPLYVGGVVNPDGHNPIIASSGAMMARKTLAATPLSDSDCRKDAAFTQETALLSNRTRVLKADAVYPPDSTRLIKLAFAIGTYSPTEFTSPTATKYITPTLSSATNTLSCLPSNSGTYCSFAEFNTVIYLSRER